MHAFSSSSWTLGLEAAAMSIAVLPTARKRKAYFIRKIPSVSRCGAVVAAVYRFTESDEEAPGGDKAT